MGGAIGGVGGDGGDGGNEGGAGGATLRISKVLSPMRLLGKLAVAATSGWAWICAVDVAKELATESGIDRAHSNPVK